MSEPNEPEIEGGEPAAVLVSEMSLIVPAAMVIASPTATEGEVPLPENMTVSVSFV